MSEQAVNEPISDELRELAEWKRYTVTLEDSRSATGLVDYVTVEFHEAFVAEMRARWERDIAKLQSIAEIVQ